MATKKAETKRAARKTKKAAKKKTQGKTKPPMPPIVLPLEELYVYKLQLLGRNMDDARAVVAEPLRIRYEAELQRAIDAVIATDFACQAADQVRVECVNELTEKLDLPKGYVVRNINLDTAEVVAEFDTSAK